MLQNILQEYLVEILPIKRVADVIPVKKLTLLHGIQGSGKSYSLLKALNSVSIIPIHINLDHSTGLDKLKAHNVAEKFLRDFIDKVFDKNAFKETYVIIDTYTRLDGWLKSTNPNLTNQEIFTLIEGLQKYYIDITIIVIGHTMPFVGRDGIFTDNPTLVRGVEEELFLEKQQYKSTKSSPARSEYTLHIQKGRGYKGQRTIVNWMRES